jgi:ubiquinone/menaquinone biosynthesis C-methylase UbiE
LIKSVSGFSSRLVVDIGSGPCTYSFLFDRYVACDIDLEKLKQCKGLAEKVQCDAHSLPFRDRAFEMVLIFDIIEHSNRYGLILEEASRVSRPNSPILLSTIWIMGHAVHADPQHVHCFTEILLRRALSKYFNVLAIHRSIDVLFAVCRR